MCVCFYSERFFLPSWLARLRKSCAHIWTQCSMKWHDAGEETAPPLPYLFAFGKIFVSFCHPTSCFIATQCLQNTPLPHTFHRYSRGKGSAGRGGDSFRVWEGDRSRNCAPVCVIFCICMAGWVGLYNPDVILPGFGLVPTLTQPTGSFAAVS